jgi:cell division protein FtsQ
MTAATTFQATGTQPADGSPLRGVRPARRRRWLRRVLILVLVLAVLTAAGWLVGFSRLFAVTQVRVANAHRVDPDRVREVAAVPLGLPLARQDLAAIDRRLSTIPQISSATVRREWPNSIKITIVERQPLLGILQPDGYAIVDRSGVVYETEPSLPRGVLRADIDPGNVELLAEVGTIVLAIPARLRKKIARITATSGNAVNMILTNGVRVNWGTQADSALKAQLVETLVKRRPSSIDVSSPHNPAVR